MARINLGDFGNVVARPEPRVQADPDAYGASVGRTLERAGSIGMHEAGQEIAQQQAQEKAETRQRQREAEAEAKATAREAKRVKALTAQAEVSNGLADLHDEIERGLNDGTIDKAKAGEEYGTRSQKVLDAGIKDVDPEHQELVRATVLGDLGRGRASVGKLVKRRDQADIRAGGLSYLEQMQRFAVRGPKEADQAIANVREFWTATAAHAGEDAATAQTRVQQFAERVRYTQATALVNADPGAAMKALKDPKYLPELDPQQRTSLIQTADVRVTQAANRAEIAARAYERKLEREWTAVSTVIEAGKALEPAYAAQMLQKFKGTPYAAALGQLMAEAPANAAFVGQPVPMQQRLLEELQGKMNREGATPELVKAYKKAEAAHKAAVTDIKADPYMAAAERGVIKELGQLTLSNLQQLPQQLATRAQDAGVVSQWTGMEVSLFRPAEALKVAEVLGAMPPKDRAGAIAGLSNVMTPGQMRAFGQQLGAKDETLAAAAILSAQGAKTTAGRLVSEIVLAGSDAIREQRIKWPSGQDQATVRAEIDKLTRGAFLTETAQRAAGDAALAVYAGLLSEGKSPDVEQAVRLTTGGIMERGGKKLLKPYGWSDSQVNDALEKVSAPKLAQLTGGAPAMVGDKEIKPEDLAKLVPTATLGASGKPGAYTLTIGGRMVMSNGRPLVVPLEDAPGSGGPLTHDGYPARRNADGSHSTEVSITVTHPRLNGGKPTNIPSLWAGKEVDEEEAVERALKSGRKFQSFGSVDDAVKAAIARSNGGGAGAR
jgi:hypothetical protein